MQVACLLVHDDDLGGAGPHFGEGRHLQSLNLEGHARGVAHAAAHAGQQLRRQERCKAVGTWGCCQWRTHTGDCPKLRCAATTRAAAPATESPRASVVHTLPQRARATSGTPATHPHGRHGGTLAQGASPQLRHTLVHTLRLWADVQQQGVLGLHVEGAQRGRGK